MNCIKIKSFPKVKAMKTKAKKLPRVIQIEKAEIFMLYISTATLNGKYPNAKKLRRKKEQGPTSI